MKGFFMPNLSANTTLLFTHIAKLNNFINIQVKHQKIITIFVKQFKAWQSHSSHRAFGISGFPAPIL
jgi:hypothetical protein